MKTKRWMRPKQSGNFIYHKSNGRISVIPTTVSARDRHRNFVYLNSLWESGNTLSISMSGVNFSEENFVQLEVGDFTDKLDCVRFNISKNYPTENDTVFLNREEVKSLVGYLNSFLKEE